MAVLKKTIYCFFAFAAYVVLQYMVYAPALAAPRTDNDSITKSCDPENATKILLIAYDTIHGSTAQIAARIGDNLCDMGFKVDVKWVGDVTDVDDYDGYIVASAIYEFNWLPDAKAFLGRYKTQLNAKKTAIFIDGASMSQDTPETRAAVMKAFVDPILSKYFETAPVSIGLFGGAFDLTRKNEYNLFEKVVLHILGAILRLPDKQKADWRNWDTIDDWAADVAEKMG